MSVKKPIKRHKERRWVTQEIWNNKTQTVTTLTQMRVLMILELFPLAKSISKSRPKLESVSQSLCLCGLWLDDTWARKACRCFGAGKSETFGGLDSVKSISCRPTLNGLYKRPECSGFRLPQSLAAGPGQVQTRTIIVNDSKRTCTATFAWSPL